jgi:hypothetical protein
MSRRIEIGMDKTTIEPGRGIGVRNKKAQIILWYQEPKHQDENRPIAMCIYRPELTDPDDSGRIVKCFEALKKYLRSLKLTALYDTDEIHREIQKFMQEMGSEEEAFSKGPEDVTIRATNLFTGERDDLILTRRGSKPEVRKG